MDERGVAYEERLYLEDPLARDELVAIRELLGDAASTMVRVKESAYSAAGLSSGSDDSELLDAMVRYPVLLQRPVFVHGGRAVVSRPTPDAALSLLDETA